MTNDKHFDVIIVGGSYAGLSSAMSLGRSLRKVLVIDSGMPCNRQTPQSHNFITHDGSTPQHISSIAKEQVLAYTTVSFHEGKAVNGSQIKSGFEILTQAGEAFTAKKVVLATGIKDLMPEIEGFAECWGISVLHCPYCHGYEVRNEKTGLLLNGEMAFEMSKLIKNLTREITIFTNGPSSLTEEQVSILNNHGIEINKQEIAQLLHKQGKLSAIAFKEGSTESIRALYAKPHFVQNSNIPLELGCEFDEKGFIKVDTLQKTTIDGIYACGDSTTPLRAVSIAIASGAIAGMAVNKELVNEEFDLMNEHKTHTISRY